MKQVQMLKYCSCTASLDLLDCKNTTIIFPIIHVLISALKTSSSILHRDSITSHQPASFTDKKKCEVRELVQAALKNIRRNF